MAASARLARVGRNAIARLGAQIWAKLLGLLLTPMVARYAGAKALGRYLLVLTVVGISGAMSDLGLSIYLTREAAQTSKTEGLLRILQEILILKLCAALLTWVLLALSAPRLPLPPATRRLVPIGALTLLPDAVMATAVAYLNGRHRMDLGSGVMAASRTVAAVGAFIALVRGGGVSAVLWWSVGAGVAGAVLGLLTLRGMEGQLRFPRGYGLADMSAWRRVAKRRLAESVPFALTGIFTMLYARSDFLLLGGWHGEGVVGAYGAAYRLWEAAGLLPASLLDALFPEISRVAVRDDGAERLGQLVRRTVPAMGAAGLALSATGALAAPWLLPLIYGAEGTVPTSIHSFRILVWAIPAIFLYLLGGHVLYALGRQRQVTTTMAGIALLNGLGNLVLIPRWRASGAATTMLVSEWALCAVMLVRALGALRSDRESATAEDLSPAPSEPFPLSEEM